jgi:hypothetical protein
MNDTTQLELTQLIRISWIVLIPVGVLLALVLYKLAMLLHSVLDFLTVARYELAPTLKDLRTTMEHVEEISARAASGAKTVERGVSEAGPALGRGVERVKDVTATVAKGLVTGVESLWQGVQQAFDRHKPTPYKYK